MVKNTTRRVLRFHHRGKLGVCLLHSSFGTVTKLSQKELVSKQEWLPKRRQEKCQRQTETSTNVSLGAQPAGRFGEGSREHLGPSEDQVIHPDTPQTLNPGQIIAAGSTQPTVTITPPAHQHSETTTPAKSPESSSPYQVFSPSTHITTAKRQKESTHTSEVVTIKSIEQPAIRPQLTTKSTKGKFKASAPLLDPFVEDPTNTNQNLVAMAFNPFARAAHDKTSKGVAEVTGAGQVDAFS